MFVIVLTTKFDKNFNNLLQKLKKNTLKKPCWSPILENCVKNVGPNTILWAYMAAWVDILCINIPRLKHNAENII